MSLAISDMRTILILTICLWIGSVYAQSEEKIQEPVPPVSSEAANAAKSNNKQNAPNNETFPSQFPVVVNVYAAEQREVKSGSNQGQGNTDPNKGTDWVAVFTGLLVLVTAGLIYVGYRQERSMRIIERAYVKMSHLTPPGLKIDPSTGMCSVTVHVKNWGRTPAEVTNLLLIHQLLSPHERLPRSPDYQRGGEQEPVQAFLVTNDEFFRPYTFTISTASVPSVCNGTEKLYLFGYVDYIDKFGKPHRAGYARVYNHQLNDLSFVTQRGYNYDRP